MADKFDPKRLSEQERVGLGTEPSSSGGEAPKKKIAFIQDPLLLRRAQNPHPVHVARITAPIVRRSRFLRPRNKRN